SINIGDGSNAIGVNLSGDISGSYGTDVPFLQHGFLLHTANFTNFTDFTTIDVPGADTGSSIVRGINDAGDFVGEYRVPFVRRGFVNHAGVFHSFAVPGAFETRPNGINSAGDIDPVG